MTANFDFLKKVDKNLYEIITEAEKLYRDEYFEQCMGQTRRFGEHLCKKVLGQKKHVSVSGRNGEKITFDDMLASLNDCSTGGIEEKEFINDLYFLKKHGNSAVHSVSIKKDGITALECLKRAFEAAISFSVYIRGADPDILRRRYNTELLITGERSEKSLAEKYTEAKSQKAVKQKRTSKPGYKKTKKLKKQSSVMVCKTKKKGISLYWILTGISFVVSTVILLVFIISLHMN